MFLKHTIALAVIGLSLPLVSAAQAQDAMTAAAQAGSSPFGAPAVSDSTLEEMSGKADLAQGIFANNSGVVSNNSVNGQSVTGTINIDGQAFQNLNGLSVLNANTGNNVSINSSMNVNVAIRP